MVPVDSGADQEEVAVADDDEAQVDVAQIAKDRIGRLPPGALSVTTGASSR